jgi:MarR family transcriptional regulator, organic hydroperoxide resistance regulator
MNNSPRLIRNSRFAATPAQMLRIAYMSMHRVSDACFLRHGVTADQFVLLNTLAEEDGINQKQLSERLSSDQNTVTAMVRLLEKRKTIRREIPEGDRRSRAVYITAKGRKLLKKLLADAKDIHRALDQLLPAGEMEAFLRALDRIPEVISESSRSSTPRGRRQ